MPAESPIATPHPVLEDLLVSVLAQLDGLCLDSKTERLEAARFLSAALIRATQSGALTLALAPLESGSTPPQTNGNSASMPPAE
jgi:hypothetical protein